MKQNTRRMLALVMALAMMMSAFALAEEVPVEVEGEPGIGGELQGLEGDVDIDLDMGEDILDLETEGELSLDLNGGLELSAETLAPVTGVAMNGDEITWTEFPSGGPTTAGDYKVPTNGVNLTQTWQVPGGTTRLLLNGDISRAGLEAVFRVPSGATLEIVSGSTGSINGRVDVNGSLTMNGGKINSPTTDDGVTMSSGSTFTITAYA